MLCARFVCTRTRAIVRTCLVRITLDLFVNSEQTEPCSEIRYKKQANINLLFAFVSINGYIWNSKKSCALNKQTGDWKYTCREYAGYCSRSFRYAIYSYRQDTPSYCVTLFDHPTVPASELPLPSRNVRHKPIIATQGYLARKTAYDVIIFNSRGGATDVFLAIDLADTLFNCT